MRQLLVSMLVATVAYSVTESIHGGVSALLGGAVGLAGSVAYAWRALRVPTGSARQALRGQQMGEVFKLACTILGFALIFMLYRDLIAVPMFLAYASTLAVYWAALLKTN